MLTVLLIGVGAFVLCLGILIVAQALGKRLIK